MTNSALTQRKFEMPVAHQGRQVGLVQAHERSWSWKHTWRVKATVKNETGISASVEGCDQADSEDNTLTCEMSFFWASCRTTFARAMSSSSTRRSLSGFDLIANSLISFELRTSKVSESNSLASISRGRMPSAKHAEREYKRSASEK